MHIGTHIDVGHLESLVLQHALHGDDVGMHLTPAEGFDGGVDDVGPVVADLEDGSHGESGTGVSVILDNDIGMFGLDGLGECAEHGGLSDACHILETDFGCSGLDQLVGNGTVIVNGMYGRGGDAERGLRGHAGSRRPLDAGDDIAHIIESAEDTRDIHPLGMLHLIHQLAHIVGHGVHAEGIETAVEHVGLDAHLIERLAESPHGIIGILSGQKVHLFESSTVCFHACEATHVDDGGSDFLQLVLPGLELSGRLPHVPIDETELDFLLHDDKSFVTTLYNMIFESVLPPFDRNQL